MKKLAILGAIVCAICSSCKDNNDDKDKWITLPSAGSTMILQGGAGEAEAENSVFVDFSANTQTSIARRSWHLAFNCGEEFGVFMNSANISRAKEAINISVGDILSEDALKPYDSALMMTMSLSSSGMDIVDAFDKSIAGTVIKEGKTYIYRNEDTNVSFYKIKVVKKDANTYTLSYSKWNSSEVKSVDVSKSAEYSVIGFSLIDEKTVVAESANWDMVWGRNTYTSAMMPNLPTAMADVVFINSKGGVKAVQIMDTAITYDSLSSANVSTITLSSDVGSIGDKWRGTSGMPPVMNVRADRYYVIQDISGNVYKLKFLAIGGTDGAVRGYPQIRFDLVKEKQ